MKKFNVQKIIECALIQRDSSHIANQLLVSVILTTIFRVSQTALMNTQ